MLPLVGSQCLKKKDVTENKDDDDQNNYLLPVEVAAYHPGGGEDIMKSPGLGQFEVEVHHHGVVHVLLPLQVG